MAKLIESDELRYRWEELSNIAETMRIVTDRYRTLAFIIKDSDDNWEVPLLIGTLDALLDGYIKSIYEQWESYKASCEKTYDADLEKIQDSL